MCFLCCVLSCIRSCEGFPVSYEFEYIFGIFHIYFCRVAQLKFYATDIKPIKVVYLEDIKTALETGGHVRYSTSFIDCQGDLKWEALGAEITGTCLKMIYHLQGEHISKTNT